MGIFCSFCGKQPHEVRHIVAGPAVHICDECIFASLEITMKALPKVDWAREIAMRVKGVSSWELAE